MNRFSFYIVVYKISIQVLGITWKFNSKKLLLMSRVTYVFIILQAGQMEITLGIF